MAARAAQRRGDEEDAEAGGDAFASAEAEPDGEHVAENGGESGQSLGGTEGSGGQEQSAEKAAEPDGGGAFEHVEEERGCAEAFAAAREGHWWRRCCRCRRERMS